MSSVLSGDFFKEMLVRGDVFDKNVFVWANVADSPTLVVTFLCDGTAESEKVAVAGDYIVQNPGGECYVVSAENMMDLYEQVSGESRELDGVTQFLFQAKGQVQAIDNPFGRSIEIAAPWGGTMVGAADCKVVKNLMTGEVYLIGGREFAETYVLHSV